MHIDKICISWMPIC